VLELSRTLPVFVVRRRWGYDEFDQELHNIRASVLEVDLFSASSTP
jgi:hypothetical protein